MVEKKIGCQRTEPISTPDGLTNVSADKTSPAKNDTAPGVKSTSCGASIEITRKWRSPSARAFSFDSPTLSR